MYLQRLETLVACNPWFIDGHARLGLALYEQGETERALEACMQGFSLGSALLPPGTGALIEWAHVENRPFLRAAHGVVLCRLRLGQVSEAISLMERMLVWNPGDDQEIRFVIGSEYLRAGQAEGARPFFETEAAHYPPCRYELSLLHLREEGHVAAATHLRRGFVENGYIAELLCGNPDPLPVGMWHAASRHAGPAVAKEYVRTHGALWHDTPDAVPFLRWLHSHPRVMSERAAILEWGDALFRESDGGLRQSFLSARQGLLDRIDDALSEQIVAAAREDRCRPCGPG